MSCPHPFGHADPAKRMSDAAMLAWETDQWDSVGKWMAFKLEDGSTDHEVYPRKQDAVRHNDEFRHCFIKLHPGGMGICEAQIMLTFHRNAYDAGFRLSDPDARNGGRDIVPRITTEGILSQMRAFSNRKRG